ncbi:MAG TPA: type I DNA topoisomerase [Trueperaceae bacterium]
MSKATPKKLVIVESPTKARTIRRFLPGEYQVEASMGHVRDLPANAAEIPEELKSKPWARLGVRIDDGFEPLYVVSPRKKQVVSQLKKALKDASELYIATDEDREGESIGWHLVELLDPKVPVKRMVFHEITADAILNALEETRNIDRHLVDAQETRRVLDRLVGYSISPLLWKKIAPKLSAGRVQSVAVRLMVLREQERLRFVPASYWDLKAALAPAAATPAVTSGQVNSRFDAVLTHHDGVRIASGRDFDPESGKLKDGLQAGRDVLLLAEDRARQIAARAKDAPFTVGKVEERSAKRSPAPPFTTSTLQQEASRKLGLSARDTMRIAQGLYENGYITYMRTDSTNLSREAITGSRRAIESLYGKEYLSDQPRQYSTKSKSAQEAHEAIRPAGGEMRTADALQLSGRDKQLYELIWKRTVACQMAEARLKFVTATIEAQLSGGETATFRASGRTTVFPGFFRAYVEGSDDPDAALEEREQPLPPLSEGDDLDCFGVEATGHETKPPARFTEASLVKLLESEGIGRPSTYASIIDTVINRGYARKGGSQLIPTFTAFATNNLLEHQFRQLVDTEFTANMEQALDDIAAGLIDATPYLKDFYQGEEGIESRVQGGLEKIDAREISTIRSEKWDPYVVRVGRFGPYVEGEIEGERATASIPEDVAPADLTRDDLERMLVEGNKGDLVLGEFPGTDTPMLLKRGRYGPYLQLGEEAPDGGKPKRISIPRGVDPGEVGPELAARLLSLPREVGTHPETGEPIEASIGPYGPYVKHGRKFASLRPEDDVLEVGLDRALELLAKKRGRNEPLKVLGKHPETGEEVGLYSGRYGPYVKHGKTNASLSKGQDPEGLTLDEALELLAAREAKLAQEGGGKKRGGRSKSAGGKKKTGGRKGASKSAKKSSGPKATPAELKRHLDELEADTAQVVRRLEGMDGPEQEVAEVADTLGLSEEDVRALHKKGMFKLRMAFGRARKAAEDAGNERGEPVGAR